MRKWILGAIAFLAFASLAWAQSLCTVTGNIKNLVGATAGGGTIYFSLSNYTGPVYISGTGVVAKTRVSGTVAADGSFSVALLGNDSLQPANTLYDVRIVSSGGTYEALYSITGASFNLNTATPTGTPSAPVFVNNAAMKPAASDAILYVSQNGSDTNDCKSWGSACLTLAKAVSLLPAVSDGSIPGTIFMGCGIFPYSSSITLPSSHAYDTINIIGCGSSDGGAGTGFSGQVRGGTVLAPSGAVTIQQIVSSHAVNQNDSAGGLWNLTIDGTNATGSVCGVQWGGMLTFALHNVHVNNFSAAGQAGACVLNNSTSLFTERSQFDNVTFSNDTTWISYATSGGGGTSFGHSPKNVISGQINSGQQGISMTGGAQVYDSGWEINGNCTGNGPVVVVDGTSSFKGHVVFGMENDGTCKRFSVPSGGNISVTGYFPNVGGFTDSNAGTLSIIGDNNGTLTTSTNGLAIPSSGGGTITLQALNTAANSTLTFPSVAVVDLTAQGANLGPTTLITPTANGLYRMLCYVVLTRAATTSSTLPSCAAEYTDVDTNSAEVLTQTSTSTSNIVGTVSPFQGANVPYFYAKAGSAIQYATANYASSGATSMQYSIHVRLEGPF